MKRLVTGLPRSRTAWMSVWMSVHGAPCIHEMLSVVPSYAAYRAHLERFADSCTYGWMLDEGEFDKILIIERDPADVSKSLRAMTRDSRYHVDYWGDAPHILDDMNAMKVPFEGLDAHLPEIHRFFELPRPYDELLTRGLTRTNIQVDVHAFDENVDQLIANAKEAMGL